MISSSKRFKIRKLSPEEKMAKARVMLLKDRPFFGTIILYLKFKKADTEILKKLIPTMGIDQWGRLFYSPDFVDSLSLEKLKTVICHEVYHAVLRHLERKSARDQKIWNYASDYVINSILVKNNFEKLDNWLHDTKYDDWYSEEVYEELSKKSQSYLDGLKDGQFDIHIYHDVDGDGDGDGDGDQEGQGGGDSQGDDKSSGIDKQPVQWDKILKDAYSYAKNQGKAPIGMERILEGLERGKVPWQSIIRKYVQQTLPKDYTYSSPHRRSQFAGFYMPNVQKEEIDVAIAIDTSGSVSNEEYMEFISEIVSMERTFKGRINFFIITADADVQTVDEFRGHFDANRFAGRGYGGTLFKPAFEYLKENRKKTKLFIYFTDLFGDQNSLDESRYPFHTLWILCENCNSEDAPFGTTIRMYPESKGRSRRW